MPALNDHPAITITERMYSGIAEALGEFTTDDREIVEALAMFVHDEPAALQVRLNQEPSKPKQRRFRIAIAAKEHTTTFEQQIAADGVRDHVINCTFCKKLVWFRDSWAPGDDAICAECDTEVSGRRHKRPTIPVTPEGYKLLVKEMGVL